VNFDVGMAVNSIEKHRFARVIQIHADNHGTSSTTFEPVAALISSKTMPIRKL
jgi:hypothetical protein